MKIIIFNIILLASSCEYISNGSNPGTLGVVNKVNLSCSIIDVDHEIFNLLDENEFKIEMKDTFVVDYWQRTGYDFLNYRCINLRKRLYMITVDSEGVNETTMGIRAYYNRQNKKWIFAANFKLTDKYRAEKAMEYFLNRIPNCEIE